MLTSYVYGCVNKCSPVVDECLEKLPFIPGVDSSALFFFIHLRCKTSKHAGQ